MLTLDNAKTAITNSNIELSLHILYVGQSHPIRFPVSGMFRGSQKWFRGRYFAACVTDSTRVDLSKLVRIARRVRLEEKFETAFTSHFMT